MNIHQLSIHYIAEQDRLLVRINTTEDEELRLWLTRRLAQGFWPLLNKAVRDHVTPGDSAGRAPLVDDLGKQMMAEFQRAQTLEKTDFKTPYRAVPGKLPLGAEPLLVTEIGLTPLEKGNLSLNFLQKLQGLEGDPAHRAAEQAPRGFQVTLEPKLVHGLVHLLAQALGVSQWQAGAEAVSSGSAQQASDAAVTPDKPKYLN